MAHVTTEALAAGLGPVRSSPADEGELRLIVARPVVGKRIVLDRAELTLDAGLAGDTWRARGSRHTDDGSAEPDRQLTMMNARAIELLAGPDPDRWALAGDQLYVDLDLSPSNLPPGTRLELGAAVIEVTAAPHNGCAKFRDRFGVDAARFVNSPEGKALNLRGINARVAGPGPIATGDPVRKLAG